MDNGASSYRRFLEGDNEGMVEIIRDYKDGLTFYLYRFTNQMNIAEELMEDTFVKLYTKRPKFSGKSSFKTWLYAIGRNCALNALRRRRWISDAPLEDYTNLSDGTDIEADYIKKEQNAMVRSAMKKLKSEYQQVLYLLYTEEFSIDETALIMHKSKWQIENLVYRAKHSLRSELRKEGFSDEKL